MKLISSLFSTIKVERNKVNCFMFESAQVQYSFKKVLYDWLEGKTSDYPYMFLEDKQQYFHAKHFHIFHILESIFNVENDKEFNKFVYSLVKNQISQNPSLHKVENDLFFELEKFSSHLSINLPSGSIEFDLHSKWLESVLKALSIEMNLFSDNRNGLELRKLYIDTLLQNRDTKKDTLIIFEYPENDITLNEYKLLIDYLVNLNTTVICFTNNIQFAKFIDPKRLYLMYNNGDMYDIESLSSEIQLFNIQHHILDRKILLTTLALHDFYKQYELMDQQYISFLESARKYNTGEIH